MAGGAEPAVAVRDLLVIRGRREVLHGLTFDVPRGQVVGLLGPSGCGKTTLLRCLVGVQVTAGGSVTVLGQPAGVPALRNKVGYSTQSPAVYADLTVVENLRYFARVLRALASDVEWVVDAVELGAVCHQTVATLSGGERGRASLAVALLGRPELLVLDEPTVGLDPVLRQRLWRLFHRLAKEENRSLVVSSHVMDEAARCQRLLLMRDGEILADDAPEALRNRTAAPDLEEAFLRLVAEKEAAPA